MSTHLSKDMVGDLPEGNLDWVYAHRQIVPASADYNVTFARSYALTLPDVYNQVPRRRNRQLPTGKFVGLG